MDKLVLVVLGIILVTAVSSVISICGRLNWKGINWWTIALYNFCWSIFGSFIYYVICVVK